jgi:hypothetical protein
MIDVDKDNSPGYQSKLEQKFNMIGAGKTFLMSLEQKGTIPTYAQAQNDPKWDFRFMNISKDYVNTGKFHNTRKVRNVELGEEHLVNFKSASEVTCQKLVRAFYSSVKIAAGAQLFWDYVYHKRVGGKCTCGKMADECEVLNRKDNYDHSLEKVLNHIEPDRHGNRRYYVKWLGYDSVNNSWADENELAEIDIFKKYEKKRRRAFKRNRKSVIRTIRSGDNYHDNADSSSGEEDDRCPLSQSAPTKVLQVCRGEESDGRPEIYCFVKFTNCEVYRFAYSTFKRRCPQLIIKYFEGRVQFISPLKFDLKTIDDFDLQPKLKRLKLEQ